MFNIDRHRITTIPKLLEKMVRPEDVESTGEEVKVGDLTLNFRIFHPEWPSVKVHAISGQLPPKPHEQPITSKQLMLFR